MGRTFAPNKQCDGKTRYMEGEAWKVARRFRSKGDACHAYKCTHCGCWHIGVDQRLAKKQGAGR